MDAVEGSRPWREMASVEVTTGVLAEIRDNFGSKPKKQAFLEMAVSNFSKLNCVILL